MSGSILKAWWNDIEYSVKSTADIAQKSGSEIEGIANSGPTVYKDEKQVQTVENMEFMVDAAAEIALRDDLKNKVIASMGFKEEDGRVKNQTGRLNLGDYNSMEQTLPVTMIPLGDWEITPA